MDYAFNLAEKHNNSVTEKSPNFQPAKGYFDDDKPDRFNDFWMEHDPEYRRRFVESIVRDVLKEEFEIYAPSYVSYEPGKYYIYEMFYDPNSGEIEPDAYGTYNDVAYDTPEETMPVIRHNAAIPQNSSYEDRNYDGIVPVFAICVGTEDEGLTTIDNTFYLDSKFSDLAEDITNALNQSEYQGAVVKILPSQQVAQINEAQLIRIVTESVKKILKETQIMDNIENVLNQIGLSLVSNPSTEMFDIVNQEGKYVAYDEEEYNTLCGWYGEEEVTMLTPEQKQIFDKVKPELDFYYEHDGV